MTATADVVGAITAHHEELQRNLIDLTDAVRIAAREGQVQDSLTDLRQMLANDIVPHARAEEDVLYAAATDPTLRPLVAGMVMEHETLLGLAEQLGSAPSALDAAVIARAIREIFVGHVRRENELLLPALAADPNVDLVGLLPVMESRFTAFRSGVGER